MRAGTGSTILLMLAAASVARTAPPQIRSIVPPSLQRGVDTSLTIYGPNLGPDLQLVLPFAAETKLLSANQDAASFLVKPAPDVPPDIFPLRVRTAKGVSNLLLLYVHDLERVVEAEPNDRRQQAQPLRWPCMVTGMLGGRGAPHPSKDVDAFRFTVAAGQRLTFISETRRLGLAPDLALCLRDAQGRELAFSDDVPGLGVEPRIDYTFKHQGDYFLEVHFSHFNYFGRNHNYQLKVGDLNYARSVFPLGGKRGEQFRLTVLDRDGAPRHLSVAAPADPKCADWRLPLKDYPGALPWPLALGDLPEILEEANRTGPQPIDWPATVNGRIARPDEVDRYRLKVSPGQQLRISADAFYHGSALDGLLSIYDSSRNLLAENDNRAIRMNCDPLIHFTVPDNVHEVTVTLEDGFGRGGIEYPYRLTIEHGGPDFELYAGPEQPRDNWPESDALNLPVGQPVKLPVRVVRYNYDGAIDIKAEDAPHGVAVAAARIPAGKSSTEITLLATGQAPESLFEISLVGEAKAAEKRVQRQVFRLLHLAEPTFTNLRWDWRLTRLVGVKVESPR